ncbi:protein MEI2-like 6 [Telopea speciosissima]|uniref:protein MEI2-like 6 n=1 Tax=Telopea speciosissima TaxID=54955 RepID=UPI001CC58E59|nr:protein MEI2-like 6 [Telopea speciosissima]
MVILSGKSLTELYLTMLSGEGEVLNTLDWIGPIRLWSPSPPRPLHSRLSLLGAILELTMCNSKAQPLNPLASPFYPSFLPNPQLQLPLLPPIPPPFLGTSTSHRLLHPPGHCFSSTNYQYYFPVNTDPLPPPPPLLPAPTYVYSSTTATPSDVVAGNVSITKNTTKAVEKVEGGSLEVISAKKEIVNRYKSRVFPADYKVLRKGFHSGGRKYRRASIPKVVHGGNPVPLPLQTKGSSPPPRFLGLDQKKIRDSTSVMVRHIPSKLSREMLINLLDKHCEEENTKIGMGSSSAVSAYDFVYLPIDFRTGVNKGYAFVNFTSKTAVERFKTSFHGYKWLLFATKKICQIDDARIQGRESLVAHFQRTKFPCVTDEYLPVQFSPPRNGFSQCPSPSIVGSFLEIRTDVSCF